MSETIKRVAHILMEADHDFESCHTISERIVRAMREPTPDQFEVANRLEAKYKADLKSFEVTGFCALVYQAMIDAELK